MFTSIFSQQSGDESGAGKEDILQTRRQQNGREGDRKLLLLNLKICHSYKTFGHVAMQGLSGSQWSWREARKVKHKDLRQVECYNCHQNIHYSSNIPSSVEKRGWTTKEYLLWRSAKAKAKVVVLNNYFSWHNRPCKQEIETLACEFWVNQGNLLQM